MSQATIAASVAKHYKILRQDQPARPGGTKPSPHVKCLVCGVEFQGGATRQRGHFTGSKGCGVASCVKLSDIKADVDKFQLYEAEQTAAKNRKQAMAQLDAGTASGLIGNRVSGSGGNAAKDQTQGDIRQGIAAMNTEDLDKAVARFVYANGISFNAAHSETFKAMMRKVASFNGPYNGPSLPALRTSLLDAEVKSIKEELVNLMRNLAKVGCTITSDGWSDARSRPLINFLQVCEGGAHFLKALNTSSETKTAAYLAAQLSELIDSIGPENVVQVVTDSAASCKAAGALITAR
jgi:hypothetical protein